MGRCNCRSWVNVVDAKHEVERRLNAASIEQLELWADRVLTAATLAELLAD